MRSSEWFHRFLTAKESARLTGEDAVGSSWYNRFLTAERAQREWHARSVADATQIAAEAKVGTQAKAIRKGARVVEVQQE